MLTDPRTWKPLPKQSPEEALIWYRCLSLFLSMGVIEPIDKFWFDTFCQVMSRLEDRRRKLAQRPPPVNVTELLIEENQLEAMFLEDVERLGFDSEQAFRNALQAQTQ